MLSVLPSIKTALTSGSAPIQPESSCTSESSFTDFRLFILSAARKELRKEEGKKEGRKEGRKSEKKEEKGRKREKK